MKVVKGHLFPDKVDVPDDSVWFRIKVSGETVDIMGWEGYVDVARQCGLETVDCEYVAGGSDHEGIPYAAVKATVTIGGESFSAIGSTDATTNGLEDMISTAQSKALKRAIRIALGIRRSDGTDDPEVPDESDGDPYATGEKHMSDLSTAAAESW